MKKTTRQLVAFGVLSTLALSGCASLKSKVKKAPCGPTAGMTDPCGNRTPINNADKIDSIFAEEFAAHPKA